MVPRSFTPSRRVFLDAALRGLGVMMLGCGRDQRASLVVPIPEGGLGGGFGQDAAFGGQGGALGTVSSLANLGALGEPDENGVRTPAGYSVRIIAESGVMVPGGGGYVWHDFPDGGATYALENGGWIYVSNSELNSAGGVGALRFSKDGDIEAAYSICDGTRMNCQGGSTPRGMFLTCEEVAAGLVYECDPMGIDAALPRPALGAFRHEAVSYDLKHHVLYLSEDETDGRFYRFVPARLIDGVSADLDEGTLEVACVDEQGRVTWKTVPDPTLEDAVPTRYQVPESTPFRGGEGLWWRRGMVYLTTKGDDRVWAFDIDAQSISVLYDAKTAVDPILTGVDAIIGTSSGELLVAEDQGDMQIVVILPSGGLLPLVQLVGQDTSEITGIAFDPSGQRLYFSSQRGNGRGITYVMEGHFPPPL